MLAVVLRPFLAPAWNSGSCFSKVGSRLLFCGLFFWNNLEHYSGIFLGSSTNPLWILFLCVLLLCWIVSIVQELLLLSRWHWAFYRWTLLGVCYHIWALHMEYRLDQEMSFFQQLSTHFITCSFITQSVLTHPLQYFSFIFCVSCL